VADSADSRKTILTVAAKLFAKLGLDKCSTREIAKESNANISLISYYFGGKEGLYKEVLRDCALEIKDYVKLRTDSYKGHPVTKELFVKEITSIVDSIIHFRKKYPEVAQIFSREKLTGLHHSKEIHEEIFYPLMQNFFKIMRDAQKQKIVKADINPALFFILMSEGIWGFYELQECPTPLLKDCGSLYKNEIKLSQQIVQIFIQGVLL
jgi:AcrR family transcriptional regulator